MPSVLEHAVPRTSRPRCRPLALLASLGAFVATLPNVGMAQQSTVFQLPSADSGPYGIASGPDGNLWFTDIHQSQSRIGRITTGGAITEFLLPAPSSGPLRIVVGPDGALWFTESSVNRIGRITTSGTISEFPTSSGTDPVDIVQGPDGNLWFTGQLS